MQLGGVTQDLAAVTGNLDLKLDIFWKGAFDELFHLVQEMAWLEKDALAIDAFGKGQELADHGGAALSAGLNHVQQSDCFLRGSFPKQGSAHENGSEGVIEIMSDAAGQGPNAFESLAAEEAAFGLLPLGDIAPNRVESGPALNFD